MLRELYYDSSPLIIIGQFLKSRKDLDSTVADLKIIYGDKSLLLILATFNPPNTHWNIYWGHPVFLYHPFVL